MRVEPRHTPEELAALARAASSGRVARRLQAVRLAMLGATAEAVGPQVLLSGRQVKTWVARYNAGGAESLADRAGRGRKPPLTPEQELRLAERLRAGPTPDGGVCSPRGADVRRVLEVEFGVRRCLQAVYDLLHRLNFEPLRPRPARPGADPAARESFKKVCPSASPPPPPPRAPARKSRSGSPTRRGSARRAP